MTTPLLDPALTARVETVTQALLHFLGYQDPLLRSRVTAADDRLTLSLHVTVAHDSRPLIGNQGNHLAALQHLVRCICRRTAGLTDVHITLDINGYRARRELSLAQLAESVARRWPRGRARVRHRLRESHPPQRGAERPVADLPRRMAQIYPARRPRHTAPARKGARGSGSTQRWGKTERRGHLSKYHAHPE